MTKNSFNNVEIYRRSVNYKLEALLGVFQVFFSKYEISPILCTYAARNL